MPSNSNEQFDPILHGKLWTILKRHWGSVSEAEAVAELESLILDREREARIDELQRIVDDKTSMYRPYQWVDESPLYINERIAQILQANKESE